MRSPAPTGRSMHRYPLLLLEYARQADTYAAHTVFGVEPDARFVLRNWSAELSTGAPVPELLITASTRNAKLVGDRIRGLDYELTLWANGDGARVGLVRMEVGYVSGNAYTAL